MKVMPKISGQRAIKVLEWAFQSLSRIDEGDLTEFESSLLQRISDKRPDEPTRRRQSKNSQVLADQSY